MRFDVLACKLIPVWALTQPNLLRFFFRVFNLPAVTQHTPDHPERTDTNRCGAVNKYWPIIGIVCDLQKLRDLFLVWIAESDRDVEVTQTEFFCFCGFFFGSMFAGLAEVDD